MKKTKIKKEVLEVMRESLAREKIDYKEITIREIHCGSVYFRPDGGVFKIGVLKNSGEKKYFLAKKSSTIRARSLIPTFLKKQDLTHLPNHNLENWEFVAKNIANVQKPLYLRGDKRIIILQFINGLSLRRAIKSQNKERAEKIFNKLGKILAKIHKHGYVHKDLDIRHVFLTFRDDDLFIIDCEKTKKGESLEEFINDINFLALELPFYANNCMVENLWRSFLEGYRKIDFPEREKILSLIYHPLPQPLYKKLWYKLIININEFLLRLTLGRLFLMKRFLPQDKIIQHLYLMKLGSCSPSLNK